MGLSIERRHRTGLVAVAGALAVSVAGCNLGKAPVNYTVNTSESVFGETASGDLNGDGALDLVVGTVNAYTVLLNDGAGGFTATETATTVPSVGAPRLVDVDSDDDLDLLSHNFGDTVGGSPEASYLWLGDGHGGFGEPTSLDGRRIGAVGDLNGDGHADLVSGTDGAPAAVVRLGDGAGGFGTEIVSPIAAAGPYLVRGEVADFNGDGDLDVMGIGVEIVCSDPSHCSFTSKAVLLTGDGTGALSASPLRPAGALDLAVGDFDEDGALDAVTTDGATGATTPATLSLLLGDGAGGIAPAVAVPLAKRACQVDVGDFDSDGHLDLVLATEGSTGTVLFGDGTGQFPAAHEIATAGGPGVGDSPPCNSVLSVHLDGDARPDVAFVGTSNNTLTVLLNRWTHRPSH
jgi:hypothetical protein